MQKFYNFIQSLDLPNKIKNAFLLFSKKEWLLFFIFFIILFISSIGILYKINQYFMIEIPSKGGIIKEGVIGSPRFINPILASSDADKDMVSLIYAGLTKRDANGVIMNNLAEKYEISENGLEYTFYIKEKAEFHNGEPVTADDVVFTITAIKDPDNKSPYKGTWDGISVEKIDEKTVKFILKQPYSSFLNSTIIGIMPSSLWNNSRIELNDNNINPIGAGPYKVDSFVKETSGIIKSYNLISFKKYTENKPFIEQINLRFYANENELIEALEKGEINQAGYLSPVNALKFENKNHQIVSLPMPRVFGLFFNQNQNQIFINNNVKKAISYAINKDKIIQEVLYNHGTKIESPIPKNLNISKLPENNLTHEENIKKAEELLQKDGWKKNENDILEKKSGKNTQILEFTISTSNTEDLTKTANLIKEDLERIGFKVEIKTFEIGNLNQLVIKPRKYEALLFGQIISHESDLYAFWHSSQRNDPGLNVAMYTNPKTDKLLEDAYTLKDESKRIEKYQQFENELAKDMPAVFLYSPNFIYVISKEVKNTIINNIISTQDRFSQISNWHTKVEKVWKVFAK